MTTKMTLAATAAIIALAGPAISQDTTTDWDANQDSQLMQDEFNTGFNESGMFDRWDTDGDGTLTSDEFTAGLFDGYDANDDDMIDDTEMSDLSSDWDEGGRFYGNSEM